MLLIHSWLCDFLEKRVNKWVVKVALLGCHIYNKMETRTLAIDKELYEEAQRFANSKGADLTKLVEAYLKSLLKEEGVEGYENIEIPTFYPLAELI